MKNLENNNSCKASNKLLVSLGNWILTHNFKGEAFFLCVNPIWILLGKCWNILKGSHTKSGIPDWNKCKHLHPVRHFLFLLAVIFNHRVYKWPEQTWDQRNHEIITGGRVLCADKCWTNALHNMMPSFPKCTSYIFNFAIGDISDAQGILRWAGPYSPSLLGHHSMCFGKHFIHLCMG